MADNEATLWGIHAGRFSEADSLFLNKNKIGIGWLELGDLGVIKADREALKVKVAECYPNAKPGAIPTWAGQLYRFAHEMKPGDLVLYPSKRDRQVHIWPSGRRL